MGVHEAVEQNLLDHSFRHSHPQGTVQRQGIIIGNAEIQMGSAQSIGYFFFLLCESGQHRRWRAGRGARALFLF